MQIEYKKVNNLIPYINNPRNNETSVDLVASSIKNFGFKVPIIVDDKNEVVAGHTRLLAAKKLGMSEVPVIVASDLTEGQIKAFRLADNKVAEFSEWDDVLLNTELLSLPDFDMTQFGFQVFNPDEFGLDFELADGDKANLEQITFTLSSEQSAFIKEQLKNIDVEMFDNYGNENKNGNAIYSIVKQWAEQKK